jgi:putative heme-binding domain-containing protein
MLYAARLALRQQLRLKETRADFYVMLAKMPEKDIRAIADVCVGIHDEFAAGVIENYLDKHDEPTERARDLIRHAVRFGDKGSTDWALSHVAKKHAGKPSAQGQLLKAILQANQERGRPPAAAERTAGEPIVARLLESETAADLQLGAELAGTLKLKSSQARLFAMIGNANIADPVRKQTITALVAIEPAKTITTLGDMLSNEKEPIGLREQIAGALASTNSAEAHAALVKALQHSSARLQTTIAIGMAASAAGGERLLQAIEAGKASPRLLQDRAVEVRLLSTKIANLKTRLKTLTQGLPPADQKTQELLARKRDDFVGAKSDPDVGQKVFQKSCANCHQVNNQGAKVGPQLDGIGVRGVERLLEDILDPNRNVDQAFRTTVITTKQGQTITGLFLREEGQVVILADKDGKDVRIDKATIDDRSVSPLSPMPSNFTEQIGAAEFNHLLAYLLAQSGKQ